MRSSQMPPEPSGGRPHPGYEAPDDPAEVGPGPSAVPPLRAILDDPEAFERRAEELRRLRPGFPDRGRPYASLLDALVWFFKAPAEATTLEANARARRPMGDVAEEERRLAGDELDRARQSLPAFEDGLRRARTVGLAAGGLTAGGPRPDLEVSFDSVEPEQDRAAGALIAYLVATDFATVRTEDLPGERYRYHIAVDWPGLDDFAARLGLPRVARSE